MASCCRGVARVLLGHLLNRLTSDTKQAGGLRSGVRLLRTDDGNTRAGRVSDSLDLGVDCRNKLESIVAHVASSPEASGLTRVGRDAHVALRVDFIDESDDHYKFGQIWSGLPRIGQWVGD